MYIESRTCPHVQMWFNSKLTTIDAKLSTQYLYTVNHVPSQMYNCCLVMLLRQLNSSKIGAWFFNNCTQHFEYLFKCASEVLTCDHHNRMLQRSIRDWFLKWKNFSRKLRFSPTKCTNFDFRSQPQTYTWIKT